MKKIEAISMFGSGAALARALDLTRGAISQWPDVLDQRRTDQVRGAHARLYGPKTSRPKSSKRTDGRTNA
ncbi:Cro/CI family transcriptional regulator [Alcaligenaceae bacterium B3P038]|nr:Cro/CI family transcriptional regulator [Alcaligenaceae bacterium B3P038]